MVRRLLRGFTFANVCSFLALTIALGTGTAYAANTVFSTDIVDGEVKNVDLAGNSVAVGEDHRQPGLSHGRARRHARRRGADLR